LTGEDYSARSRAFGLPANNISRGEGTNSTPTEHEITASNAPKITLAANNDDSRYGEVPPPLTLQRNTATGNVNEYLTESDVSTALRFTSSMLVQHQVHPSLSCPRDTAYNKDEQVILP
jgi:hypothetical protein